MISVDTRNGRRDVTRAPVNPTFRAVSKVAGYAAGVDLRADNNRAPGEESPGAFAIRAAAEYRARRES